MIWTGASWAAAPKTSKPAGPTGEKLAQVCSAVYDFDPVTGKKKPAVVYPPVKNHIYFRYDSFQKDMVLVASNDKGAIDPAPISPGKNFDCAMLTAMPYKKTGETDICYLSPEDGKFFERLKKGDDRGKDFKKEAPITRLVSLETNDKGEHVWTDHTGNLDSGAKTLEAGHKPATTANAGHDKEKKENKAKADNRPVDNRPVVSIVYCEDCGFKRDAEILANALRDKYNQQCDFKLVAMTKEETEKTQDFKAIFELWFPAKSGRDRSERLMSSTYQLADQVRMAGEFLSYRLK